MSSQKHTLNLSPAFLLWSLVFAVVALIQSDWSWLWVAAAPWLIWFGFVGILMALACGLFFIKYLQGYPITLTRTWRGVTHKRVVQRKGGRY